MAQRQEAIEPWDGKSGPDPHDASILDRLYRDGERPSQCRCYMVRLVIRIRQGSVRGSNLGRHRRKAEFNRAVRAMKNIVVTGGSGKAAA